MRLPFFRFRRDPDFDALRAEIAEARREIDATRPIVEEAIRRTNQSFIAVENETLRQILKPLLGPTEEVEHDEASSIDVSPSRRPGRVRW